ncbi:hypothetical protein [Lentibacillus juripiscarius]
MRNQPLEKENHPAVAKITRIEVGINRWAGGIDRFTGEITR